MVLCIGEDLNNIKSIFPSKCKVYLFIPWPSILPTYTELLLEKKFHEVERFFFELNVKSLLFYIPVPSTDLIENKKTVSHDTCFEYVKLAEVQVIAF